MAVESGMPIRKPADHAAAMALREPAVEIQEHAGKQPSLGDAEQDADGEEAPGTDGEGGRGGAAVPS